MPEISRFYGIVIKIFHNDHHPAHFHAEHGGDQMIVDIGTLGVIAGKLRPRATGLVMEWASQHQDELRHVWEQARNQEPLDQVDPLP
jgi:predicted unusual protein kinase regulating ubiquinone biosynthesis (AarF/ABC1/UbiB family)